MVNAIASNKQKIPEEQKIIQGVPILAGAFCPTQPRIIFNAALETAPA